MLLINIIRILCKVISQSNRVLATNLNVLITEPWQPDNVNLWFFKLRLFDKTELKYLRSTTSGRKDLGVIKSEFVAKTRLLYKQ